jgi:hypothetical protein
MAQVIVYTNESGGVSVCVPTGEASIEEVKIKDTPDNSVIVYQASLPNEHGIFFDAWQLDEGVVSVNLNKAKTIAHDKRREARSAEFAPLDIKATIPSEATAAEAARQAVREKYATMQTAIDAASTVDEIKAAMPKAALENK